MADPQTLVQYINAILKYNSFNKAARTLYVTQPYLTDLIHKIERQKVGTTIINRAHRPYSLTDAGKIYYNYLEKIISDTQQLNKELVHYNHPKEEVIRIGIFESLGTFMLPKLLPQFLKEHPKVTVQLFEDFQENNERKLLNEKIDCYIGQAPETLNRGATCSINGSEQYYVVIPKTSQYYHKDKFILDENDCDISKLILEPLVLSSSDSEIRHQVNYLLQKFHVKPKVIIDSDSIITTTNLALQGVGLTISTSNIISNIKSIPANLYPINKDIIQLQYFIATKKNRYISPALKDLINDFKQIDFTVDKLELQEKESN